MKQYMMLAAVAGAIWYAAPQARDGAVQPEVAAAPAAEPQFTRWRVSGSGEGADACHLTIAENDGAGELVKTPGCAATGLARAERWWEDAEGDLVLSSAQGEKLAEFTADETDGMYSVWPDHTLVTLSPAR